MCYRLGVHTRGEAIAFHYYQGAEVWNTKIRHGKGNMPWAKPLNGRELIFWNVDCLHAEPAPDEFVIITEGEPDALSCLQVGFTRVISLPNGAQGGDGDGGFRYLYETGTTDIIAALAKFPDCVLAVDADAKGNACRDALLHPRRLGDIKTRVAKYPKDCKDANDVLVRHGPEKLRECISSARHVWRDELRRLSDVPEPGIETPYKTGVVGLDDHGFRFTLPGLMCVVGPYKSGKSVLVRQMLANLWRLHGFPFVVTAFEERIKPRLERAFRKLLSSRFLDECSPGDIAKLDAEIERMCVFLMRPRGELMTMERLINRIEIAVLVDGVKVVAIDPINEIDHNPERGENTTDYMARFIMQLKQLADDHGLLIICCVHPPKLGVEKRMSRNALLTLNDAAGTAHWGNKSDIGLCVWRANDGPSILHIDKLKDEEVMGKPTVAKLLLDASTERFTAAVIGYRGFLHPSE